MSNLIIIFSTKHISIEDRRLEKDMLYHYNGGRDILAELQEQKEQKSALNNFINRQIKNPKLNIFIGSGASVGAVDLMGKTLVSILKDPENSEIKNAFIEFLNLSPDDLNVFEKYLVGDELTDDDRRVSEAFSNIEGFLTFLQQKVNVSRDHNGALLQVMVDTLKNKFVESIPKFGDSKYDGEVADTYYNFYQHIFNNRQNSSPKLNVFTTNYDLFNERALERHGIGYTTGFKTGLLPEFDISQFNYRQVDERNRYKDRWQPTTKEANLYKLHGSINWYEENKHLLQLNNSESTDTNSVIIYPTILKHEETAQIPYSPLFRELSIQLQKPDSTLIIIGYGFGDDHINNLIFQNLSNQDFTLIIFGDVSESKLGQKMEMYQKNNLHIIGGQDDDKCAHYFKYIVDELLNSKLDDEEVEESIDE